MKHKLNKDEQFLALLFDLEKNPRKTEEDFVKWNNTVSQLKEVYFGLSNLLTKISYDINVYYLPHRTPRGKDK